MPGAGSGRAQAQEGASKELRLIEAAAQEFNARGIAGASIARIAKAMGLTRAAVYYYVKDRDTLAAQCYAQTCSTMRADLDTALRWRAKGLDKLLVFLRLSLDPNRAPTAALSELDYFDGPRKAQIAAAHHRNVEALRALIREGIEDGSIRACDDEIAAQTIIGLVTWIPLSVDWVEGTDSTFRARTVEAACALIVNGQAADPDYEFVPPVAIESFFAPPPQAFDRESLAAAKIEQMLMTASRLFNTRGIDGTSLDDVMAALGATKGTLYHYLDNKTDLVARCYRRGFLLYERFADACELYGRNGLERGLIGTYLNVQAHARELSPLIQMAGAAALPAAVKRDVTRRSRALQKRFRAFGDQGLADGSFRPLDFDAMAQLGAGAFEWLPKWFRSGDPRAGSVLAQEIVAIFIRGLRKR
ncbi:MAG TPA: TetR/AcrR family transcriptional regulator [Rhizomicrobium sp.]|nr:TetR/AcrR family transcriptional regulator [Rhizomicrobium sp.]